MTLKTTVFTARAVSGWGAFAITLLACPLFIYLAPATGLFDEPESERKIHGTAKPLGGAALVLGFLPLYLTLGPGNPSLVFGLLLVFLAGLIDDLFGLDPKLKLLFHASAAVVVSTTAPLPGTRLAFGEGVSLTLNGATNSALLAFWLVGGTNGFNLIDGLDGLATGTAAIALLPVAALGFGAPAFLPIIALLGSLAAVLIYNFHPAKLFLGDAGSYSVGFLTSYLVVTGLASGAGTSGGKWSLAVGLLLLGLPVADTALAVIRRSLSGKGIMEADRNHVHHFLYRRYGHTRAVLMGYGFQGLLAIVGGLLVL